MGLFGLFGKKNEAKDDVKDTWVYDTKSFLYVDGFLNNNENNEFKNSEHDPLLESEIEHLKNYINSFKGKLYFNRDDAFKKLVRGYLPSNIENRPEIYLGWYIKANTISGMFCYTNNVLRRIVYKINDEQEIDITDPVEMAKILEATTKPIEW